MGKRRKMAKRFAKKFGITLLLVGIILGIYEGSSYFYKYTEEKDAIDFYYNTEFKKEEDSDEETVSSSTINEEKKKNKIEYIAILKIPKINLERGLVNPNSYLNNVKYNVEILDNSSMPDKDKGNFILAAHSGNSKVSYFKKLNKLEFGDSVFIDYKGATYNYVVTKIYDVEKTGKAQIIRNKNKNTLTLVTCRANTNKQIIVICEKI